MRALPLLVMLSACGGGASDGDPGVFFDTSAALTVDGVGDVSLGVPFAQGAVRNVELLRLLAPNGDAVSADFAELATWPDGSLRAVALAFSAAEESYSVDWSGRGGPPSPDLLLVPDGDVVAYFAPEYYAYTGVLGRQGRPESFSSWDDLVEGKLEDLVMPWRSFALSCGDSRVERTYYDAPHALYQRFVRNPSRDTYQRAREEARWYRDNEVRWFDDVAVFACQGSFDPDVPMSWRTLRNMWAEGMLDDYLLTGDPDALAVLTGFGEAYRQNLDALLDSGTLRATERNLGWTMMGMAAYHAVSREGRVRTALDALVEEALDWQGQNGAFEHDVAAADDEECGDGPRGASPFMTSLLMEGLLRARDATGDGRIEEAVLATANWYRADTLTADGRAFQYLWNCRDRDYSTYTVTDLCHDGPYLNLLIAHVFGAAYDFSGDSSWIEFGDRMATHGIEQSCIFRPKEWTQATRSFGSYLGYRESPL